MWEEAPLVAAEDEVVGEVTSAGEPVSAGEAVMPKSKPRFFGCRCRW